MSVHDARRASPPVSAGPRRRMRSGGVPTHWSGDVLDRRAADAEGWDAGMRARGRSTKPALFFDEVARLRSGLGLPADERRPRCGAPSRSPTAHSRVTRRAAHAMAAVPARLHARQLASIVDDSRRTANAASSTRCGSRPEAARPRRTSSSSSRRRSTIACAASARASPRGAVSRCACCRSSRPSASRTCWPPQSSYAATRTSAVSPSPSDSSSAKQRDTRTGSHAGEIIDRVTDDPTDPDMPRRYQVLLRCPFCGSTESPDAVRPDAVGARPRVHGAASARGADGPCRSASSTRRSTARCPTVVLGTLDKAASISMQAAMRGFYGAARGTMPGTGPRVHLRAAERYAWRLPLPRLHRDHRTRSARTASCTRRPSACRTNSTCSATASVPSTRTTRHSSTRSRPTTAPSPEDHRVLGHARRARRTGRGAVPARRADVPASRPPRRPLLLVARHRCARSPLRWPRAARGDAGVRDRPVDRSRCSG